MEMQKRLSLTLSNKFSQDNHTNIVEIVNGNVNVNVNGNITTNRLIEI